MTFLSKLFNKKEQSKVKQEEGTFIPDLEEDFEENTIPEEEMDQEESDENDPDIEYEVVEREILPTKIICPDCGGITLEGLDFCDKCGGEL